MPPALKYYGLKIAERRKQLLRGIGKGKRQSEITKQLGISESIFGGDVRAMKKGMKPEAAARLRASMVSNIAIKFSRNRAANIISLARKVINGETVIPGKPMKPRPTYLDKHPNKAKKILQDLRLTKETLMQIAVKRRAPYKVVVKAYGDLKAKGENIPKRMRGGMLTIKDKGRITGVLRQRQINKIMELQDEKIVAASRKFYYYYKPLFGAAVGWEDIAQYIRKELPWKLLTFDPAVWEGNTIGEKVEQCCRRQIRLLALSAKRVAGKKFRPMQSLEKTVYGIKAGGRVTRQKDIIPAKEPTPSLGPKEIITAIEAISGKAALTKQQKAVVYCKAAGINYRQIAEMANVSQSAIGALWLAAKKKLSNAGITYYNFFGLLKT